MARPKPKVPEAPKLMLSCDPRFSQILHAGMMQRDHDVFKGDLTGAAIREFWNLKGWTKANPAILGCRAALINGAVVGYCLVQGAENIMFRSRHPIAARGGALSYVVDPSHAGKGLARWLAGHAIREAAAHLAPDEIIFMQARKDNPASLAVGQQLGMAPDKRARSTSVRTKIFGEEHTVYVTRTSTVASTLAWLDQRMPAWEARVVEGFGAIEYSLLASEKKFRAEAETRLAVRAAREVAEEADEDDQVSMAPA